MLMEKKMASRSEEIQALERRCAQLTACQRGLEEELRASRNTIEIRTCERDQASIRVRNLTAALDGHMKKLEDIPSISDQVWRVKMEMQKMQVDMEAERRQMKNEITAWKAKAQGNLSSLSPKSSKTSVAPESQPKERSAPGWSDKENVTMELLKLNNQENEFLQKAQEKIATLEREREELRPLAQATRFLQRDIQAANEEIVMLRKLLAESEPQSEERNNARLFGKVRRVRPHEDTTVGET